MRTARASSSCSSSRPGARPTKPPWPAASACRLSCLPKAVRPAAHLRRPIMPMNVIYKGSADLPENIPVFPLPGALLLPRGQMPLNIFEPRYLAMVADSLRDGHRLIGMIQPDPAHPGPDDKPTLF